MGRKGRSQELRIPPELAGRAAIAVAGTAVAGAVYQRVLRERVKTFGASDEEASARLPGDELLVAPDEVTTRAISINAPSEAVWPWLAQMGPAPRGGAYTYDWIENLMGLGMHSSDTVLAEYQDPRVGDSVSYGSNVMRIASLEPGHHLCWLSTDGRWLWTFALRERERTTRLLSRNAFRFPGLAMRVGAVPMELGSLVMERRMLAGIRDRAESLARTSR